MLQEILFYLPTTTALHCSAGGSNARLEGSGGGRGGCREEVTEVLGWHSVPGWPLAGEEVSVAGGCLEMDEQKSGREERREKKRGELALVSWEIDGLIDGHVCRRC